MRSRSADAANLDVIAMYGANRWPALRLDAPFASARIAAVGLVEAGVFCAAISADSSAGAARR